MAPGILITGAAGYIGGSVLTDFVSKEGGPIKGARIYAAVRTEDQAQALSRIDGVKVLRTDLTDESSVRQAVLENEIDIVLHIASSIDQGMAENLVNALGERHKASGGQVFYVQSSVNSMYSAEGGWTFGEIKDTENVFEKEKQIGGPNPVRLTNIRVVELAKERGVTAFNVALPLVHGTGSGVWKKVSAAIPNYVRASIAAKQVYKFDVEGRYAAVHITDLVALYALLTNKMLNDEPIPSGEHGYYFAFSHRSPMWAVMERIATALHSRGLVPDPSVKTYPDYDVAAKVLGLPRLYIAPMCIATGEMVAVNAYSIGWEPQWNEERYLASIDDEVQAALDLDTIKTSRYDALLTQ